MACGFVNLAALTDPGLVISTIAATLDVRETSDGLMLNRLRACLQEKQTLLVLDKFERILTATPLGGTLRRRC
jgi:predicted ATPase